MKSLLTSIVVALTVTITQTSCRRNDTSAAASSQQPNDVNRSATVAYWKSQIEIDTRFNEEMKQLLAAFEKGQKNQPNPVVALTKAGAQISKLIERYNTTVGELPVRNVEQRLLDETSRDMRAGVSFVQHLNAMAEAADAYVEWSERKKSPSTESFLGDLLDSFIMGLQGQPFAGYNKMKNDATALDTEGQRIAGIYMSHVEALSQIVQENADDKVKEMELRAFLAKKYDVEFPPKPHFD